MLKRYILCTLICSPIITYSQVSLNTSATLTEVSNSGTHAWIDSTLSNGYSQDALTVRGFDIEHVNETSNVLRLSDFNFNIPENAIIESVSFTIRRRANGGSKLIDEQVRIETYGTNLSYNLANSNNWTTSFEEITYSGSASDWGVSLTPEALNRSDFSLIFQVGRSSNSTTSNQSPEIDFFGMSVSYSTPLPITLNEFKGSVMENGDRQLFWSTATEFNNSHFILQRRTEHETFVDLARISGAGTSDEMHYYELYDRSYANDEILYYRIIQVDQDGKKEIFNPIALQVNSREDFTVYPNPTIDYLVAKNLKKEEVITMVKILSIDGQDQPFDFNTSNDFSTKIDVHDLPSGSYYIIITLSDGRTFKKKFIKN